MRKQPSMKKQCNNTPKRVLCFSAVLLVLTLTVFLTGGHTKRNLMPDLPCTGTPVPDIRPGIAALSGNGKPKHHEIGVDRSVPANINSHSVQLHPGEAPAVRGVRNCKHVLNSSEKYEFTASNHTRRSPPIFFI